MSSGLTVLGKFQRGMPGSLDFSLYNFAGGLNVKDLPQQVGDSDLTEALNVYLRPGGGVATRMSMTLRSALGSPSDTVQGVFQYYRSIVSGVPVTPSSRTLLQIGNSLYWEQTNTLIGGIGGFGINDALPMTAVQFQNPNDGAYPDGLTDCVAICSGAGGPYIYDGTRLYHPIGWNAAKGAKWCAVVNGVVWFGGIESAPNQIFGTGTGQDDDASMQQLPAYRNFVMSGPVMGLCAAGTGATAALVIGRSNGLTIISGTGSSNFEEQDLPQNDGVTAGRTMCTGPNGEIYFLGNQAVYVFAPQSSPQAISYKVEPWILNDSIIGGLPITARPSCFAWVYNNRYHLGYYSGFGYPGYGVIPPANTILVFDLSLGGWTVLQTTPGIACAALLNTPADPSPWQVVVGSSSTNQAFNWDVEPLLGQDATDAGVPFTVTIQSKFFKLGEPGTVKALRRLYPEFFACGTLSVNVTAATDYGTSVSSSEQFFPFPTDVAEWDISQWDEAEWAADPRYLPIVAPATRVDYDGVSGDSFAFGVNTSVANPPWMLGGWTGVFHQRGRV